ncbi:MAG TPA: hypothetical protein VER32_08740 [Pyrinomonadaceae bacterium]|nr:hypothetical protein [Pyrinomonadaceae bacterium]
MQMGNNALAHVLKSSRDDQKVELSIESRDGQDCVALRYSTWTEGLGWSCQKTIRLDAEQLDELHRAVTVARHRVNRRRADEGQPVAAAKVIEFPTVA